MYADVCLVVVKLSFLPDCYQIVVCMYECNAIDGDLFNNSYDIYQEKVCVTV